MKFRPLFALLGALTISASAALAQAPLPSYSATTVQTAPDQPDRTGVITKSGNFLRLEFTQDGQQVIQILRPTEGLTYVLYPASNSYVEQRGPAQPEEFSDSYTPPCPTQAEDSGLQCNRLGLEIYQSIAVERWHIGAEGDPGQMLILWDPTRKRALRQEMSNGTLVQMTFLGLQEIESREAEHWITEVSRQGRATLRTEWWYDNELKLVLRETLPDGTQRHLQNVTIGPVAPSLFTVPDNWQRLDAPAPPKE
ncbi:MAG: hypothetical protein COB08_010650 [Rhodobacteraceae bacterium]|nr:hypothetical protein [Paracoccaceae bacterium]